MSSLGKRLLGGTHPSAEERLVSEESAGRTPKAARRCRPAAQTTMQARGVRISNIVCFAVIDCDIDLRLLAIALGARFDKGIFPSAVVVIAGAYTESDARAAVHRVAFAIHCRFKASGGGGGGGGGTRPQVSASVRNFKVNNVVGSASLGFRVDLAACYADNQDVCNYNPTNFSGLQYRYWQKRRQQHADVHAIAAAAGGASCLQRQVDVDDQDQQQQQQPAPPTISFAVFESGKMVLTGAREFQDLVSAFEASKHVFFAYRVKPAAPETQ